VGEGGRTPVLLRGRARESVRVAGRARSLWPLPVAITMSAELESDGGKIYAVSARICCLRSHTDMKQACAINAHVQETLAGSVQPMLLE